MINIKTISYQSDTYQKVLLLRNKILRNPLGLKLTKEDTAQDKDEIIIAAFDADRIVGCVQLRPIDKHRIKLRQMAVEHQYQRRGMGLKLVKFAEQVAINKQFDTIVLHARKTAVGFYTKMAYQKDSDIFTEVGLPHHRMYKSLKN